MAMIPSSRAPRASNTYDVLPDEDFDARIVRFIGLGVQDQPVYEGKAKEPAFKCSIQFELIGVDASGKDSEGKPLEPRPACQFKDFYLFPNAKRGNVFDLVKSIDPSLEKVPADLHFFTHSMLNKIVNVKVGHYIAKDGTKRNKISSITPIPAKYQAAVGPARCELVGFDPYENSDEMQVAYSKLFKFQRDILEEAHDVKNIPFAGTEPLKLGDEASSTPTSATHTKPASRPEPQLSYDDDMDEAPF